MSEQPPAPTSNPVKRLNRKQEIFVATYMATGSVTRSAQTAGYARSCWKSYCSELLRKTEIRQEMARLCREQGADRPRILAETVQIALTMDIADFQELLDDTLTLQEIRKKGFDTRLIKKFKRTRRTRTTEYGVDTTEEVELVMCDRQRAIEKLGEWAGMDAKGKEEEAAGAVEFGIQMHMHFLPPMTPMPAAEPAELPGEIVAEDPPHEP